MSRFISLLKKATPYSLRLKLSLALKEHMIEKTKLLFIHIPKNAGTSIATEIYGKTLGHFPAKYFLKKRYYKDTYKFAIKRDPKDRFISAFNFMKSGGTKFMKYSGKLYKHNIDEFIDCIYQKKIDVFKLDHVFWPQSYFLNDDINLWDISDLDNLQHYLNKELKKDLSFKPINTSKISGTKISKISEAKLREIYKSDYKI